MLAYQQDDIFEKLKWMKTLLVSLVKFVNKCSRMKKSRLSLHFNNFKTIKVISHENASKFK